jgi:hypothetical protein
MTTNIFDKALEILGPNGEHWTSVTLREEVEGKGVCYCLLGAIFKAYTGLEPVPDDDGQSDWVYDSANDGDLKSELTPLVELIKPKLNSYEKLNHYDQSRYASSVLYRFNDTSRTFDPIAEVLQEASRKVSA